MRLLLAFAFAFVFALGLPSLAHAKDRVLWDSWYTVTLGGKIAFGYYNDHVEEKGKRIYYQNRYWKKEQDFINEEQLGAFAENDASLTPLFFNFHSTFGATETQIDGTVTDGKQLTVRVRKDGKDLPLIRRSLPKGVILSTLFPIWLGRKLPHMKVGQTLSFSTILEDNLDIGFRTVPGTVRLEKPDEFARSTRTAKLALRYRDLPSVWYVEANGDPVRMDLRGQNARVERVAHETAERFLDEPAPAAALPENSAMPSPTPAPPAAPSPAKSKRKTGKRK